MTLPSKTELSPTGTVSQNIPPQVNSPIFGTNGLFTLPQGGTAIDTGLLDHANNQINALTGIYSTNNSPAVQSALDRALAAIRDGYNALISEP